MRARWESGREEAREVSTGHAILDAGQNLSPCEKTRRRIDYEKEREREKKRESAYCRGKQSKKRTHSLETGGQEVENCSIDRLK